VKQVSNWSVFALVCCFLQHDWELSELSILNGQVMAKKPLWDLGAKTLLKKPAVQKALKTWAVNANDVDDLIDDDDLLSEEDKKAPAPSKHAFCFRRIRSELCNMPPMRQIAVVPIPSPPTNDPPLPCPPVYHVYGTENPFLWDCSLC
jgi:hypothetical protein